MRYGSLFSGIGGLDLGLDRAGMECAWQVEIDPYCRKVLARHWPDVPRYEDVRDVGAHNLEPVDLVCGGFPCQPVSVAGKRLGQDDERWLWPEFARILGELRPRYALMENVPGLLARGMGDVLGDLATLGYDAEWESIPAAAVGAPHLRYRVFLLAYRPEQRRAMADSGSGRRQRSDVRTRRDAVGGGGEIVAHAAQHGRGSRRARGSDSSGAGEREHALSALADTAGDGMEGDGADRLALPRTPTSALLPRCDRPGGGGSYWSVEPDVGRVANGVPARVDRLRALGNAVVPQVAEWIGRRIMDAHYGD